MDNFIVSSSPHVTGKASTRRIMLDVIIALLPALAAATVIFGPICIAITALSVAGAVLAEFICRKIMKRPQTVGDLSAAVTGLILALNLPATASSLWMAPLGSIIAIVVVKQFFGGIGQNFVNPALAGRIILMMSFTQQMSSWVEPMAWLKKATDATAFATPLGGGEMPGHLDMLLGLRGGCMGETCALALLLGGIYLCIRRVIMPTVPVIFCGTAVLCVWLFSGFTADPLNVLLSGGLLIGAIFMATDYATSPIHPVAKIIYAAGCGIITAVIRQFGSLPEGVSFSILIMNIITPHLDRAFVTKPFGAVKTVREGK